MEKFLTSSKQSQVELPSSSEVHVVLGNEACDLDSAVSAIVYGYYLSKKFVDATVIPLLNIPQSQYSLHTEVNHLFKRLNLPAESLTFRDQVNLGKFYANGKLTLHLVDHNALTGSDVDYKDCVATVIDHHKRECPEREGVTVKLDFVGSCATLVAEELLHDTDFQIDDIVAELLLGTILVDTINRSPDAGKITPRDQHVLDQLQALIPDVKGDNLYQELHAVKFNMGDLTNMDILEKDLKMVPGSGMTIAMASVTMEMEDLLQRPDFQKDLADFCEKKGADVVVIMTLTVDENDVPTRQIAVYSQHRIYKDQIADVLDSASDESLDLEPCFPPFDTISVFKQGNAKASRKKVMPILKSFLQGDITPDVTSKDFATQISVSMATEGFSSFSTLIESGQTEGEGSGLSGEKGSDPNSSLLDLDDFDPIRNINDSMNNVATGSPDTVNTHLANIPEEVKINGEGLNSETTSGYVDFQSGDCLNSGLGFDFFASQSEESASGGPLKQLDEENVKSLENPSTNALSSTNFSSANSSNIFDFVNSDSELVDPFSSVEDNLASLPNWKGTQPFNSENESKEVKTSESQSQSTVDIDFECQSTSLAQDLADNQHILDVTDGLPDVADGIGACQSTNQALFNLMDDQSPLIAQTSDSTLSSNPFFDISTDTAQPSVNNSSVGLTNIGEDNSSKSNYIDSNLMGSKLVMDDNNPFCAENALEGTCESSNIPVIPNERDTFENNADLVDTGFFESQTSFERDSNNPFGIDSDNPFAIDDNDNFEGANLTLIGSGNPQASTLFGGESLKLGLQNDDDTQVDIGETQSSMNASSASFAINSNNPFGTDGNSLIGIPINTVDTEMDSDSVTTGLHKSADLLGNDTNNVFGLESSNPFVIDSSNGMHLGVSNSEAIADSLDSKREGSHNSFQNNNPFGQDLDSTDSINDNPLESYASLPDNGIDGPIVQGDINMFETNKHNPFDLPPDVQVATESQFEDIPEGENHYQMEYLDIGSNDSKGKTRPKARKSISLIVEMDEHSTERLDEFNEADFYDKVTTPEIQNSGETSPFVNSGVMSPFEGILTPSTGGRSARGSGYPSVSTPPNSVAEGNGFEIRDHDLPSFNSAEMVERIHKKKASLGNAADFQGIDIENKTSVPYTPRNSFRDDLTLPSVSLTLPDVGNSEMEHTIQVKRNSLIAAQDFTSAEDYLLDLSRTNGAEHSEITLSQNDETDLKCAKEETPATADIGNTSSDLLGDLMNSAITTSSDSSDMLTGADLRNNLIETAMDSFIDSSKQNQCFPSDIVPDTPTNSYVESSGASYMKGSYSLTNSELFDRLSSLKRERCDTEGFQNSDNVTSDKSDIAGNPPVDTVGDMNNFDPFFIDQDKTVDSLTEFNQVENKSVQGGANLFDQFTINKTAQDEQNPKPDILDSATMQIDMESDQETKSDLQQSIVSKGCEDNSGPLDIHSDKSVEMQKDTDISKHSEQTNTNTLDSKPDLVEQLEKNEEDVLKQFEVEMLQTAESDVIQHVSTTVTHDLMKHAIDIFPDMTNPAVAEYVTEEILQESSRWTDQGSGDSGIGSSDSPQQGTQRPPPSPRTLRRNHVAQYSLETDYLPNMDPLHGNLNIVTSPSTTHSVETDADKEVVEGESFRKASFDGDPLDQSRAHTNDGVHHLTDIAEKSVTETIIAENLKNSHIVDAHPFKDVDSDTCGHLRSKENEVVHISGETNQFEVSENTEPDAELYSESEVLTKDEFNLINQNNEEMLKSEDILETEVPIYSELENHEIAKYVANLGAEENVVEDNLQQGILGIGSVSQNVIDYCNVLKDSDSMICGDEPGVTKSSENVIDEELVSSPDINMMKDSESMIDEEEVVSPLEEFEDNMMKENSEEFVGSNQTNDEISSFNEVQPEHAILPNELLDQSCNAEENPDDSTLQKLDKKYEDSEGVEITLTNSSLIDDISISDSRSKNIEPTIPPNDLSLNTTSAVVGDNVSPNPVEIHVEECSISPDSSNSYNSSTDSEVDLVTVKENIIDSSPTDINEQFDETNTESHEMKLNNEIVKGFGGKEIHDKDADEMAIKPKSSPVVYETFEHSSLLPDLVIDTQCENADWTDNTLLLSSQTESNLIESTMTIETISPAETPEQEHAAGFYEVNPEVKETIEESYDMEKSVTDTNLGDNVTGYYEVNPELVDDQMIQSDLTVETISPVGTPNEEHATGLYEINPENDKIVDSDMSEVSVSPLESSNGGNTEGFNEINERISDDEEADSDLTDERISPVESVDGKQPTGLYESKHESDLIGNAPEINVSMTDSTETENSDIDGNVGFYEMNSEIQGTVLQNIEIGDAFSPAESPNDDIIGISYKINPMIPDLPNESSNETDDNEKSDVSVFDGYTETKICFDDDGKNTTDAVLFSMADCLVNKAIKGAFEEVHELRGREESDIADKLAEAMLEDDESSDESSEDSDASSTTTEGSYRIDCSPVMTPESESMLEENVKKLKNKDVYVIEEAANEEEVEDVMTIDESDTSLFKELDKIDDGNIDIEEDVVNVALEQDIPKFTDEFDDMQFELTSKIIKDEGDQDNDKELHKYEEPCKTEGTNSLENDNISKLSEEFEMNQDNLAEKHQDVNDEDVFKVGQESSKPDFFSSVEEESVIKSQDTEHNETECSKPPGLVRQETVIPDIVIIPEDSENSTDNEGDVADEPKEQIVTDPSTDYMGSKQSEQDISEDTQATIQGPDIPSPKDSKQYSPSEDIERPIDDKPDHSSTSKTDLDGTGTSEHTNDMNVDTGARSKHSGTNNSVANDSGARSKHSNSVKVHKSERKSSKVDASVSITKSKFAEQEYLTRKEIFYTTAGNMSVSIDSVVDPPGLADHGNRSRSQNPISEQTMQLQVAYLLARIRDTTGQVDEILDDMRQSDLTSIESIHDYLTERLDFDLDTISLCSQPDDDFDPLDLKDDQQTTTTTTGIQQQQAGQGTQQQQQKSVKQKQSGSTVRTNKKKNEGTMKDMEDTQEWHEDPIPGMGVQEVEESSDSESDSDSDSEYGKPVRPDSLLSGKRRKKKISANSNMVTNDSADDLLTPDDIDTPDDMEGELEWEDDTPITPSSEKKFADYIHSRDNHDDEEEEERKDYDQNPRMKKVEIAGKDYKVDMHVIEPYKKVLSHGGYYGDGLNAIILFCGCYLPDRSRRDYQYVMDNLFLYVISTLELLVAEDYMIVYFHGATPRRQMPSFGWLKRCYQMIDRRLRKNLKALLMVHPTLWLKTVVMMTKPFISTKFSSKLRFVKTLQELGKIVPMEYIYVPDPVQQYDIKLKQQRNSSSSTSPATPVSPT